MITREKYRLAFLNQFIFTILCLQPQNTYMYVHDLQMHLNTNTF